MLTARTKTIERTGTGLQFPPSLASLSATKFSLQIYMELTVVKFKSSFEMRLIYACSLDCIRQSANRSWQIVAYKRTSNSELHIYLE